MFPSVDTIKKPLFLFGVYLFLLTFVDFKNIKTDYVFLITGLVFILLSSFISKKKQNNIFIISFFSYVLICFQGYFFQEKNYLKKYKNMHRIDKELGYTLTPNWRSKIDNKLISINSDGYRDEEFKQSKKLAVLLGDSFTFGNGLDQKNKIDEQTENSCPPYQIHNLGVGGGSVSGYGLESIIKTYKKYKFKPSHVYYLFYNNDLSSDSFNFIDSYTIKDGYLINKKTNNVIISDEKMIADLKITLQEKQSITKTLKVRHFFSKIKNFIFYQLGINIYEITNNTDYLLSGSPSKFSDDFTYNAYKATLDLKNLVVNDDINFIILIIPTEKEVATQKYSHQTQKYINLLSMDDEIKIIESISKLKTGDYIKPNGYLSKSGSKIVGKLICKSLNIL